MSERQEASFSGVQPTKPRVKCGYCKRELLLLVVQPCNGKKHTNCCHWCCTEVHPKTIEEEKEAIMAESQVTVASCVHQILSNLPSTYERIVTEWKTYEVDMVLAAQILGLWLQG